MPFSLKKFSEPQPEEKNQVASFDIHFDISDKCEETLVLRGGDLNNDDPEGAKFFSGRFYTVIMTANILSKNGKSTCFYKSYNLGSPELPSNYEAGRLKFVEDLAVIYIFAKSDTETSLRECRNRSYQPININLCRGENNIVYLAVDDIGYYLTPSEFKALGDWLYNQSK